jgi:hypothetical protein
VDRWTGGDRCAQVDRWTGECVHTPGRACCGFCFVLPEPYDPPPKNTYKRGFYPVASDFRIPSGGCDLIRNVFCKRLAILASNLRVVAEGSAASLFEYFF